MHELLDGFYPKRAITVTSADPYFVTPAVNAMLRRKNRLMRTGRTDEAGALAARVSSCSNCYRPQKLCVATQHRHKEMYKGRLVESEKSTWRPTARQ